MHRAQESFLKYWKVEVSEAAFKTTLARFATAALEKVFNKTAITALPVAVVSALSSANEWEKNEVLRVAQEGFSQLTSLLRLFLDNKEYTSITFRVNYLAFKNLATGNVDFTIVQGNIIPTKIVTSSGGTIIL